MYDKDTGIEKGYQLGKSIYICAYLSCKVESHRYLEGEIAQPFILCGVDRNFKFEMTKDLVIEHVSSCIRFN
jgi:hypothetical protein